MDRSELRRLQKAARDNNKFALSEWASAFENQVRRELEINYDKKFKQDLKDAIDNIMISIAYVGVFGESTQLTKENIAEFMSDLFATIDMFRLGEYKPEDYIEQLKEYGIYLDDIVTKHNNIQEENNYDNKN